MSDNDQINDEERLNDPRHEQVEDNDRNNHTKDENPDKDSSLMSVLNAMQGSMSRRNKSLFNPRPPKGD